MHIKRAPALLVYIYTCSQKSKAHKKCTGKRESRARLLRKKLAVAPEGYISYDAKGTQYTCTAFLCLLCTSYTAKMSLNHN